MASAFECDRCNKLFKRKRLDRSYNIVYGSSKLSEDLCPECSEELDKRMKNEAVFVPKEEKEENVRENV